MKKEGLLNSLMPYIVYPIVIILSIGLFALDKILVDKKISNIEAQYYVVEHSSKGQADKFLIMDSIWAGYLLVDGEVQIEYLIDTPDELVFPKKIQSLVIDKIVLGALSFSYTPKKVFIPENDYMYIDTYDNKRIVNELIGVNTCVVFLSCSPEDYINGFYYEIAPYMNKQLRIYVPGTSLDVFRTFYSENENAPQFYAGNISYMCNYAGAVNSGYHWIDYVPMGNAITTIPDEPKREGYNFLGWYLDSGCLCPVDLFNYIVDKEKVVLYAGWEKE